MAGLTNVYSLLTTPALTGTLAAAYFRTFRYFATMSAAVVGKSTKQFGAGLWIDVIGGILTESINGSAIFAMPISHRYCPLSLNN